MNLIAKLFSKNNLIAVLVCLLSISAIGLYAQPETHPEIDNQEYFAEDLSDEHNTSITFEASANNKDDNLTFSWIFLSLIVLILIIRFFKYLVQVRLLNIVWILVLSFIFKNVSAQPASPGTVPNASYFAEEEELVVEGDITSEIAALQSEFNVAETGKDDSNALSIAFIGVLLFLVFAKLLKLIARLRFYSIIIGFLILFSSPLKAQPKGSDWVNNDAYFGKSSDPLGPVVTQSGPPPPPIPIDSHILFLIGSGVAMGIYGIYRRTKFT